jgi:ABC-type uncharacterized transport system auxiliary subunit
MSEPRGAGRRMLLRLPLAIPAGALTACFGGRGQAQSWWELEDAGAPAAGTAAPDPVRKRLSLLVEGMSAGSLYDGVALLYSSSPGMRAPYQYAGWTERPSARLARLAARRLLARGGFRDVSLADAGTAADLLLSLTLETLHHELPGAGGDVAAGGPAAGVGGSLRLAVTAQLVDWRVRRPLASRGFMLAEPVATADAAGAVQAAGRAIAALLDVLAPWVEANALDLSRARPAAPR